MKPVPQSLLFTHFPAPVPTKTPRTAAAVVVTPLFVLVPVTVMLYCPLGVVAATVTLIGTSPSDEGAMLTVVVGIPTVPFEPLKLSDSVKVTIPVKPSLAATSIVL
jgi:hypothetical protein